MKADGPAPPAARRPTPRFIRLSPDEDDGPGGAGGPVVWKECGLGSVSAADLSAALAVGLDGVYAPDLHAVPPADALVEASLEWRPYREGDRAVVTLRAGARFKEVRFADRPELHLQLDTDVPDDDKADVALEEPMRKARDRSGAWVTPLTIEARLPAGWRERCGVHGAARVSVLVTSGRVEVPRGRREEKAKVVERADPAGRPPVWAGVVQTGSVEVRFPSAGR